MSSQPANPEVPEHLLNAVVPPPGKTAKEAARDESRKVWLFGKEDWLRCFEGFVDGGQMLAILVSHVADHDGYVLRVRLTSGDLMTLKLGPYANRDFAESVALEVLDALS
jgi:hypothetical protein